MDNPFEKWKQSLPAGSTFKPELMIGVPEEEVSEDEEEVFRGTHHAAAASGLAKASYPQQRKTVTKGHRQGPSNCKYLCPHLPMHAYNFAGRDGVHDLLKAQQQSVSLCPCI